MRRTGIILIICGALFAAGAVAWSTTAVSKLVKFPTSTNTTLHYSGHFVTYVNAKTGATLAQPSSVALTVDRTVKAVPSLSTGSVAVVDEDIVLHYGGTTATETNVYAFNRTTMGEVASSHAYTFAPSNPAPLLNSYYITLPMNLKPGVTSLNIWKPETGTTYALSPVPAGSQPSTLDGLKVDWFAGGLNYVPVASYERTALAARGLPMSVSPTVVEAEMSSAGISVPALETALAPTLTPTQLGEVSAVLKTPVPLHYYVFGSGFVGAEPRTGAIIDLKNIIDGIAVAPSTTGLNTLIAVMSAHSTVKGVPAALAVLRRLAAAPPQKVYELQYSQTPASVLGMVNTAQSQLKQIRTVTYYVPIGLGVIALLLLLFGGTITVRRRRLATVSAHPRRHVTSGPEAATHRRHVA